MTGGVKNRLLQGGKMPRQLFHFVAGDQHIQFYTSTVLDAWLNLELRAQQREG
jgi:hypothetical protein